MDLEKLTLKDFVYIATLSDFGTVWPTGSAMLKLDVVPGEYSLAEYLDGYILAKEGYTHDLRDVVKIFNTRDGDKGLSGTYWEGQTKDEDHMRLFNDYFRFHLHRDYLKQLTGIWSDDEWIEEYENWHDEPLEVSIYTDTEDSSTDSWQEEPLMHFEPAKADYDIPIKKLHELSDYHNLPVLFYSNEFINADDLSSISLKFPVIKNCGNVTVVWRIVHDQYGDIGIAVQQELYNMMGDQAGLAFFVTTTANAFGNFDYYKHNVPDEAFRNEWVTQPRYDYQCERNPCHCDWKY